MGCASDSDDPNMLTFCLIPTCCLGVCEVKKQTHYTWRTKKILLTTSLHKSSWRHLVPCGSGHCRTKAAYRSQCSLCHTTLSDQQLSQRQPLPPTHVADQSPSFLLTPASPDPHYQRLLKADQFHSHTTLHPDGYLHWRAPSCLSALS